MAKGNSGRIVVEVDPAFKQELYEALGKEHLTLKKWFLESANLFLKNKSQLSLLPTENEITRKVS